MTLELLRLPGLQYSSEHKTLVASPALLSNTDVIVPLLKLAATAAKPLKRGTANLLAGRAVLREMFPLTAGETEFSVPVRQLLRFGSMPLSVNAPDDENREDFLRAYVTTYLSEEIKAEGLVRNLGSFSRFLDVAALAAGQRVNVSNIARDAAVSRETARGFFEVLVDTLIGSWLPAYRPRARIKEVAQPQVLLV